MSGNAAASDPWLGFDKFNNLFFSFIAFQRTPPGKPASTTANALAIAKFLEKKKQVAHLKTAVKEASELLLATDPDREG